MSDDQAEKGRAFRDLHLAEGIFLLPNAWNAYRQAGADCLFVPGVKDADTIAALVREVDGPINVVVGLAGNSMTVARLRDLGVKRVSIGGSLARATFRLMRRAAEEMFKDGSFTYSAGQVPDAELCAFFAGRRNGSRDR